MNFYTYILASRPRGTLYIGVTRDIETRVYQHKKNLIKGFTFQYNVKMLVHLEMSDMPYDAIAREKQLKHWNRAWKIRLIEESNPLWKDLAQDWFAPLP
jgi:putative endonuclease